MNTFDKDDRVVVKEGEHKNQHGKIVSEEVGFGWNNYKVALDNDVTVKLSVLEIENEDSLSDEIWAAIKNITKEIKQASSLPQEMKTELPTHIGYAEDALRSKNKSRAEIEYQYIKNNLERLSKEKVLSQDWMQYIRIDFEKIYGAIKRLS